MGLVDREQRSRFARDPAQRFVEPPDREDEAGVRHGRLGQHDGDVPRGQRPLDGDGIVEGDDACAPGHAVGEPIVLGHDPTVLEHHHCLVEVPVVLAVEDEHHLPPGRVPGEPDHLGVRLRRGQRELPLRHAVAGGEVLGDRDRVLAGKQELVAELHAFRDRLHDRRRGVSTERAHVGHVHVEVRVAVEVGEIGTRSVRDGDRRVLVEVVHPGAWARPRHASSRPLERAIDRGRSRRTWRSRAPRAPGRVQRRRRSGRPPRQHRCAERPRRGSLGRRSGGSRLPRAAAAGAGEAATRRADVVARPVLPECSPRNRRVEALLDQLADHRDERRMGADRACPHHRQRRALPATPAASWSRS